MSVKCQALDIHGKPCRKLAVARFQYHGDDEIYGFTDKAHWVRVWLCAKHGGSEREGGAAWPQTGGYDLAAVRRNAPKGKR